MSKDENEAAEAPKKSNKMLMIIVIAVVVLAGGGVGAFLMLKGDSAKAEPAPEKGAVVAIKEPLTLNLAEGHYLKLAFSLQQTADAAEEIDTSEAINLAIDEYTGKTVAELSTEEGRETAKDELLKKIVKVYTEDGTKMVMDMYFTQFVTQ